MTAHANPESKPGPTPHQFLVPMLGELLNKGDGTFILRPAIPQADLDTWLTVRQTAELVGNVKPRSIYPLLGEFLVYRRPLKARVLVSMKSALAFKRATLDPEFWGDSALRRQIQQCVRQSMENLASSASGEAAVA